MTDLTHLTHLTDLTEQGDVSRETAGPGEALLDRLGRFEIEWIDWSELKPHPSNPNSGDGDAMADSLIANGLYRPLICAHDLTILAGHTLYESAGRFHIPQLPVVRHPIHPDSPEAIRLMLVDNRQGQLARMDDARLLELLQALDDAAGLTGSGYIPDDLEETKALLRRLAHTPLGYGDGYRDSGAGTEGGVPVPGSPRPESADSREPGLAERARDYEAKGVRYIMLEYPLAQFSEVVDQLAQARERFGAASNSEAVAALLAKQWEA